MGIIVIFQRVELKLYIVIINVQEEMSAEEVIISLKILENGKAISTDDITEEKLIQKYSLPERPV